MIARFGVNYSSGDLLADSTDGERQICIGVARAIDTLPEAVRQMPQVQQRADLRMPKLWFWVERSEGAGVNAQLHKSVSRWSKVGFVPLRGNENPWAQIAPAPPRMAPGLHGKVDASALKLNFPFPCGQTAPTNDHEFDVQPAVVTPILGMRPGEVISIADTLFIVIGLAVGNGQLDLWLLQVTHPGATILQGWEMLVPRLAQRTGKYVDLVQVRAQLRGNRFNPEQMPYVSGTTRGEDGSTKCCCAVM
eukprot:3285598-Amphidinium_carterae.2